MRLLPQLIPITEERRDVLDEILNHFTFSQAYCLRKRVMPIGNTEIPEVKETKLNICINHCSKRHINEHLKNAHHIKNRFLQHTFVTLGYTIPNQKRTMSYFYRKNYIRRIPLICLILAIEHLETIARTSSSSTLRTTRTKGTRSILQVKTKETADQLLQWSRPI